MGLNFLMFNHLERKKRNKPTPAQARGLELAFQAHPKPSKEMKVKLCAELNLNLNSVQIWFQNRRAKHKHLITMAQSPINKPTLPHLPRYAPPLAKLNHPECLYLVRRKIQLPNLNEITVTRSYQSSDPALYHLAYPSPTSQNSPTFPA
ncbi:hypothetical protein L0F63_006331 [Massospora cicadina]|nr:hypothetical protein L0F63_006331 [Massospora cicadina]